MKKLLNISSFGSFAVGILLILTYVWIDRAGNGPSESEAYDETVRLIESKLKQGKSLGALIHSKREVHEELRKIAGESRWRFCIYHEDSLSHWSDNEWLPDSVLLHDKVNRVTRNQSGLDLELVIEKGEHTVLLNLPITRRDIGTFEAQNTLGELERWDHDFVTKETAYKLPLSEVYIKFFKRRGSQAAGWMYVIGLMLLVVAVLLCKWGALWYQILILILIAFLRWLSYQHVLFTGVEYFELFDPIIYASSRGLPSLGDLLYHILLAFVLVLTIQRVIDRIQNPTSPWLQRSILLVFGLIMFFGLDLILAVMKSLVLDSNLSFDTTHFASYTSFAFMAFLMMGAMFWLFLRLCQWGRMQYYPKVPTGIFWVVIAFAGALFALFQYYDANRHLESLLEPIGYTMVLLLILRVTESVKIVYRVALLLTLFTLIYSQEIYLNQNNREAEYVKIYASKLVNSNDLQAEYIFSGIETKLVEEFLVPKDFASIAANKDQFEKRLKRLYFSGYLDKYDVKVLSFDSVGTNINSSTLYNFEDLNEIYTFNSFPTLSNHFYQIKSTEITNGYLAKFENCDLYGHYGNVFLLLEPKFIQSTYSYPELTRKKRDVKLFELEDYSYAIYNRGALVNQKGDYSYDFKFDSSDLHDESGFWNWRGYRHFIHAQQEELKVVLSKPNDRLVSALSTFTMAFLFYAMALGMIGVLRYLMERITMLLIIRLKSREEGLRYRIKKDDFWSQFGFDQLYLSTRIRFAMVALVILGLLLSLSVTVQFISYNDSSESRMDLMYKIREVVSMVQEEVDLEDKLRSTEARKLIVNEISDVYKVEVNIFEPNGNLIVSSEPELLQEGLLAPIMAIDAFHAMHDEHKSQFIADERIRGLSFLSAYVPLLNDKREVIAYLNIPYFSRQGELEDQISAYIVAFVNLYFFLIILALLLAYFVSKRISKPLEFLREKFSRTSLDKQNEMIDWRHNDEIGQLVRQYNKMVAELRDSAEKLGESEREGAWKEMARQVAHEIKNPLTPMKLNVQHLQRAWASKSDNMDMTIEKVTRVLIEQIDSLSKLASEFSSFAKMPLEHFEEVDLTEVLLNTIHLFEKSEKVSFSYDPQLPEAKVTADKNQLGRVFNNLIKNAIQSIPEDGKGLIGIDMRHDAGRVRVAVRDNGIGIDEKAGKRIFVPNFSTKTSGMGLGLAITKKIVEASNGDIWFESKVGEGSTFYVEIPLRSNKMKE